jgi:hypothetical protein
VQLPELPHAGIALGPAYGHIDRRTADCGIVATPVIARRDECGAERSRQLADEPPCFYP